MFDEWRDALINSSLIVHCCYVQCMKKFSNWLMMLSVYFVAKWEIWIIQIRIIFLLKLFNRYLRSPHLYFYLDFWSSNLNWTFLYDVYLFTNRIQEKFHREILWAQSVIVKLTVKMWVLSFAIFVCHLKGSRVRICFRLYVDLICH